MKLYYTTLSILIILASGFHTAQAQVTLTQDLLNSRGDFANSAYGLRQGVQFPLKNNRFFVSAGYEFAHGTSPLSNSEQSSMWDAGSNQAIVDGPSVEQGKPLAELDGTAGSATWFGLHAQFGIELLQHEQITISFMVGPQFTYFHRTGLSEMYTLAAEQGTVLLYQSYTEQFLDLGAGGNFRGTYALSNRVAIGLHGGYTFYPGSSLGFLNSGFSVDFRLCNEN